MNPKLPDHLDEPLRRWCQILSDALGDALQAVVLYGGLAKGEFVTGHSDINLVILLRTASLVVLDRAAPILQQGAREFRLSPMLLTEAELREAAEVFPIKFQDMQRHHVVLWGEEVLDRVTVTRAQLILRCEQELRNLVLRLRQSYIERAQRPELLQVALNHGVSSLLVNLGVLLELKTGKPVHTKQDALEQAAQLGLPEAPLRQVWALKRGESAPDAPALRQLYAAFMDSVQQAAGLAGALQ